MPVLGVLDHADDLAGELFADVVQAWCEVPANVQQDEWSSSRPRLDVGEGAVWVGECGAVERIDLHGGFDLAHRRLVDGLGLWKHGDDLSRLPNGTQERRPLGEQVRYDERGRGTWT